MDSLSRLYGFAWSRHGEKDFVLELGTMSDVERITQERNALQKAPESPVLSLWFYGFDGHGLSPRS